MSKLKLLIPTLLLFALTACGNITDGTMSPGPPLIESVAAQFETFAVERGRVEAKIIKSGIVRAPTEAVAFEVYRDVMTGDFNWDSIWNMLVIMVHNGQEVYEGQVIARIDEEQAEEALEDHAERLNRMRRLHSLERERLNLEIDFMILDYNEAIRTASETLDPAALDEAAMLRNRIERAELNLSHVTENQNRAEADIVGLINAQRQVFAGAEFRAPFDGIVTNFAMTTVGGVPGQMLTQTFVVYIARPGGQVFLEYVGPGGWAIEAERVYARIDGRRYEIERMELTAEQRLYYSARAGVAGARGIPTRFNFLVPEDELPPLGSLAFIYFITHDYEDVLRAPRQAFFSEVNERGEDIWFATRINEDGQTEIVEVEVRGGHTYMAIHSGLEEGDVIIVRPTM